MARNYLFVFNPIAGKGNTKHFFKAHQNWLEQTKHNSVVYETTGQKDLEAVEKKVSNGNFTHLIAVGGDGTLNMVAQIARKTKLILGFFPAGSANGMARQLQLPDEFSSLFKMLEQNNTTHCDMLCFNQESWGLHISDIGLNAALVEHFEKSEGRGLKTYGEGVLKLLPQLETFEVSLTLNGKTRHHSCLMVAFANARYYGTGASLNNSGKINDGRFEVCVLEKWNTKVLAQHWFNILSENSEHLKVYTCQKVEVKTKKPQVFQIDGELRPKARHLSVVLKPKAIALLVS